jgi:hypothetical protein
LAALHLDTAEHGAALARGLRIAVAARDGADSAAAAIDAEINGSNVPPVPSIISKSPVPYDLLALSNAIERPLADADAVMALERMFDFIDLAPC